MKDFLAITIEGRHFVLSKDAAHFLADRLHTAITMPATALLFQHKNAEGDVSIQVKRCGRTVTDC